VHTQRSVLHGALAPLRRSGVLALLRRSGVLVALTVSGCGVSPLAGDRPADAVRRGIDGIVAHDLLAASAIVCPEQRDGNAFPFVISGIFEPTGSLDTGSFGRRSTSMTSMRAA
jgi:hypothetical protein